MKVRLIVLLDDGPKTVLEKFEGDYDNAVQTAKELLSEAISGGIPAVGAYPMEKIAVQVMADEEG